MIYKKNGTGYYLSAFFYFGDRCMLNRRKFIQSGSLLTLMLLAASSFLSAENKNFKDRKKQVSDENLSFLSKLSWGPQKKKLEKLKKHGFQKYLKDQLNAPKENSKEIKKRLSELKLHINYEYNCN